MARAPRVFAWSDGLHAYTVAASSKAKALAAWGVGRDLFKDGEAREITEGPAYDAALATPGEVVRTGLHVSLPDAPKRKPGKGPPKTPPARPKPSKADLARAKALEREFAALDRDDESLETEIAARRARLDREAAERRAEIARRRKVLETERTALRAKLDGG